MFDQATSSPSVERVDLLISTEGRLEVKLTRLIWSLAGDDEIRRTITLESLIGIAGRSRVPHESASSSS